MKLNENRSDIRRGPGSIKGIKRGPYNTKKDKALTEDDIYNMITSALSKKGYAYKTSDKPGYDMYVDKFRVNRDEKNLPIENKEDTTKIVSYLNSIGANPKVVEFLHKWYVYFNLPKTLNRGDLKENSIVVAEERPNNDLVRIMVDVTKNLPAILGDDIAILQDPSSLMDLNAQRIVNDKISRYLKIRHGLTDELINDVSNFLDDHALAQVAAPNTRIGQNATRFIESLIRKKNKSIKENLKEDTNSLGILDGEFDVGKEEYLALLNELEDAQRVLATVENAKNRIVFKQIVDNAKVAVKAIEDRTARETIDKWKSDLNTFQRKFNESFIEYDEFFKDDIEYIIDHLAVEDLTDEDYEKDFETFVIENIGTKLLGALPNTKETEDIIKYFKEYSPRKFKLLARVFNHDINESLIVIEEPVETTKEETPAGPEMGPEVGLSAMLINAIKEEYDTINTYNDLVVQAEVEGFSDIASVVRDIANEENIHVGQLQAALETISPNAESVEEGKVEAEKQMDTTTNVTDTFNI